jgi:hypothetical protein
VDLVQTHYFSEKVVGAEIEPETSDHYTTEAAQMQTY